MWTSQDIIKLELGRGIIEAANSPDSRNFFQRLIGTAHEDDVILLLNGIKEIREDLYAKGIILPAIKIVGNDSIAHNEFRCHWGIEILHYSIPTLESLFSFILDKALEYGEISKGKSQYFINLAHKHLGNNAIQKAYDAYLKGYYNAFCCNEHYECAQILSEVSVIIAPNQYKFAKVLLSSAIKYTEMPNIVDTNLKCQVYFNAASITKDKNPTVAAEYFRKCGILADNCKHNEFALFSLLGLAEIYTLSTTIEERKYAIQCYEEALKRIEGNREIVCSIQEKMIFLYQLQFECLQNRQKQEVKSKFAELLFSLANSICKGLGEAIIFKLLNVPGGNFIFSIGGTNTINKVEGKNIDTIIVKDQINNYGK